MIDLYSEQTKLSGCWIQKGFLAIAVLFNFCLIAQLLTVGLAVFDDPTWWHIHVLLVRGYSGLVVLLLAGLLEGYRAATHWAARGQLAALGIEVGTERVVIDRNRITGGGVTAGIDFGLTLASILYGEEIAKITQLLIEYNPAPPFDTGSPEKAEAELVEKAMLFMQGMMPAPFVAS